MQGVRKRDTSHGSPSPLVSKGRTHTGYLPFLDGVKMCLDVMEIRL